MLIFKTWVSYYPFNSQRNNFIIRIIKILFFYLFQNITVMIIYSFLSSLYNLLEIIIISFMIDPPRHFCNIVTYAMNRKQTR